MKLRASTKILFGFIGLVAVAYGGNIAYTKISLGSTNLNPVPSGDVCLIALNKEAGVRDIVANHMVQIVEASGPFGGSGDQDGGRTGSVKKRIPVKELIAMLNGDVDSVEAFLRKMRNSGDEGEVVEEGPVWVQGDIEKAIAGDATLKAKFENDINMSLDGTPKPTLNRVSFFDGIRIKIPISMAVPNAKGPTIEAFDVVNFKPRFMSRFYKSMREKFYDKAQLQDYYASFLKDEGGDKEKIVETLKSVFARSQSSEELGKVKHIAENTKILASQSMISSAEMVRDSDGKDVTYDLKLHLTPEGKNRLWKFSSEGGTRIILVSKGVAIASATIGTQLNSEELVIKQIADPTLLEEAVSLIRPKN